MATRSNIMEKRSQIVLAWPLTLAMRLEESAAAEGFTVTAFVAELYYSWCRGGKGRHHHRPVCPKAPQKEGRARIPINWPYELCERLGHDADSEGFGRPTFIAHLYSLWRRGMLGIRHHEQPTKVDGRPRAVAMRDLS